MYVFYIHGRYQFGSVTLQVLSTHMPLITAVMESAGVDIREARGQGSTVQAEETACTQLGVQLMGQCFVCLL